VFAGIVALAAAGLAKLTTPERAQAGHNTNIGYDSQTVMHLDVTNTTAGSSRISSNISGTAAFVALNNYPVGISRPDGMLGRTMYTTSNCAGVAGTCEAASGGNGVMGAAKATNGVGVYGFAGSVVPSTLGPGGTGVYGSGPTNGLFGNSAHGIGVTGQTTDNVGVSGVASTTGWGVYGLTGSGIGVIGVGGTGLAGYFVGNTVVNGPFTVVTGPKSAGVQHTDGTLRRMYCQESPEPWFEDFGRGTLEGGKAEIALDPGFVGVVKGDDYDVFLTPYGDSKGLYVSSKVPGKFTVAEQQGGTSKLAFGYRVVARRRDDVGKRLEKLDLTAIEGKGPKRPGPVTLTEIPAPSADDRGAP
jgi:hypothetical protein